MTPGQGYVRPGDFPVGHPQFGQLVPCPACSSGSLPAYLKRNSRLVGELTHAAFEHYIYTFERRAQLEAAQALSRAGHGWLTIWGTYGQSKSYLLACIVNAALAQRRPAVYTTTADLLDHLRSAYHPDGPGFSDAFAYWCRARVLAVDEIDRYNPTAWAEEKLRQLIGYRYDRREELITAFASEVEPGGDDWPASLGWLASRMKHSDIVQACGGDIRPQLRRRHDDDDD